MQTEVPYFEQRHALYLYTICWPYPECPTPYSWLSYSKSPTPYSLVSYSEWPTLYSRVSYSKCPTPYSRVSFSECPTAYKCDLLRIDTIRSPGWYSFCNQPVLFAQLENVNKLRSNNRTVHGNERNQNKNKTKSRHIQIDHAFYCSI